eukprot:4869295-Pleurochrysis_carterae.AAC.1
MPLTPPDASVAPSRESARERAAVSSFSASDEPEAPSDAHPTKPWTRTRPPRLHAGCARAHEAKVRAGSAKWHLDAGVAVWASEFPCGCVCIWIHACKCARVHPFACACA